MSATLPSGHLQISIHGRGMLKNNSVNFLAICANFPSKIEKFELEVVRVGILGTGFCFQEPLTYLIAFAIFSRDKGI